MSLPSEFVLVPRPSSSCSIFWRRDRFEDEDEGRGRPREHLAEERFMGRLATPLRRPILLAGGSRSENLVFNFL